MEGRRGRPSAPLLNQERSPAQPTLTPLLTCCRFCKRRAAPELAGSGEAKELTHHERMRCGQCMRFITLASFFLARLSACRLLIRSGEERRGRRSYDRAFSFSAPPPFVFFSRLSLRLVNLGCNVADSASWPKKMKFLLSLYNTAV